MILMSVSFKILPPSVGEKMLTQKHSSSGMVNTLFAFVQVRGIFKNIDMTGDRNIDFWEFVVNTTKTRTMIRP